MIPSRLLVYSINLVAMGSTGTDLYGNDTLGEIDRFDNLDAWVEQFESMEMYGDRYTVVNHWRIFFNEPTGFTVDDLSEIEYGSKTLEVIGSPEIKSTPRGVHHYELIAKEVLR